MKREAGEGAWSERCLLLALREHKLLCEKQETHNKSRF